MKALSQKRRHPLAVLALLVMALLLTGGLYAVATTTNEAKAETTTYSAQDIEEGQKLFLANCSTCHGLNAEGTEAGPSLIGVGAASVDFQVGTGRMPMQMQGPQAQVKPEQFNEEQTKQLAGYVASLGAGPASPRTSTWTSPRVTPPTVPRSSWPTAPCATTLPAPVAL